jgi:hypothetical protein
MVPHGGNSNLKGPSDVAANACFAVKELSCAAGKHWIVERRVVGLYKMIRLKGHSVTRLMKEGE